jgi:hypothetical protein
MRFLFIYVQRRSQNKHLRFPIHVLHALFIPSLVSKSYAPRFCHVRTSPVSLIYIFQCVWMCVSVCERERERERERQRQYDSGERW